jgi:hypothetical protein
MSYSYDRTASVGLESYINKLRELDELLEDLPEFNDKDLHPSFVQMVKTLKKELEKERFQTALKTSGYRHKLMDLKKLLDESAEAKK